ncbi:YajQ family cyclic di-GMP-binding protein [Nocardia yunnanensis]|uniref:Nucleotide-binding protein D7D52_06655 n=1 Tax=Nocardia yunnanensis TaxID=2382165 RepID=A0A386Z8S1_9NOCA|nr:YajQ family cyclic di-GMP-binding protein [Nocardia yunnanensis]
MGRSGNLPGCALRRGDENTSNPLPQCKPAGYRHAAGTSVGVRTPKFRSRTRSTSVADSSFDVVSKIDRQEVDNALNQAAKELSQRYDFRGTGASIEWSGEEKIILSAESEDRVKAALDVFKEKLIRRDISLKAFDAGDPQASGKVYKITGTLVQGITTENAKKIAKKIRDEGPKSVKAQIQGEELRVSSKNRDDLQAVIALLKGGDFDIALQFVNYR